MLDTEAPRTVVLVNDTTYRIVEDFGKGYIVQRSEPNGELAFHFKVASPEYGRCPVLGDEPLGDVFWIDKIFGITTTRSNCAYSHREWSRWRRFSRPGSIYYTHSPAEAWSMVHEAGLKWMKDNA